MYNKRMKKNFLIILSLVFCFYIITPANAQSISELEKTIQALLSQVESLRAQLGALSSSGQVAVMPTFSLVATSLTRNLYFGLSGTDVLLLQKTLNLDTDTMVSANGAGSRGNETTYFGKATENAVKRFQNKNKKEILSISGAIRDGVVDAGTKTLLQNMIALKNESKNTVINNTLPTKSKPDIAKETLVLEKITPETGGFQPTITLIGNGFNRTSNTVHTTYDIYENVPSADGKTITLKLVSEKFPASYVNNEERQNAMNEPMSEFVAPAGISFPIPVFVVNELGTSTIMVYVVSY